MEWTVELKIILFFFSKHSSKMLLSLSWPPVSQSHPFVAYPKVHNFSINMFKPNIRKQVYQIGLEKAHVVIMWSLNSPCSLHSIHIHIMGPIQPLFYSCGHVSSAFLLNSHKNILRFGVHFVFQTNLVLDTNNPLYLKWWYVVFTEKLLPLSHLLNGLSSSAPIGA